MTRKPATADPLAEAALLLHESARDHKRQSAFHRRRAQECMQDLERVRAMLAKRGIKLIIQSEGKTSHGFIEAANPEEHSAEGEEHSG